MKIVFYKVNLMVFVFVSYIF